MSSSPALAAAELLDLGNLGWARVAPALRASLPADERAAALGLLILRARDEGGPGEDELLTMWTSEPERPLSALVTEQARALRDAPVPEGIDGEVAAALRHRMSMVAERFLRLTSSLRDADPRAIATKGGFLTWDGLMAQSPPEWLVPGLVPVGGVGSIIGQSQSLKTFLLIHLGLSLATGRAPLGEPPDRPAPTEFALVVGEGASGIMGRMRAWAERYGAERPPIMVQTAPADLGDAAAVDALVRRISEAREPGMRLVVGVDTLSANFSGDENGPEVAQFVRSAARLSRELRTPVEHERGPVPEDATVVFVHHLGKDATRGARGHSSLHANVDFELTLRRCDAAGRVRTRVTCTKQKDGPTDFDRAVEMTLEHVDMGDGGLAEVLVCSDRAEDVGPAAPEAERRRTPSQTDKEVAAVAEKLEDFDDGTPVADIIPEVVALLGQVSNSTVERRLATAVREAEGLRIEHVAKSNARVLRRAKG